MICSNKDFRLVNNNFWTEVLAVPENGQNELLKKVSKSSLDKKIRLLSLIVEGFYPISSSSPITFNRVYELSNKENTKNLAKKIYEIELGKHPLIKKSKYKGIPHNEQFRLTIESLIPNIELLKPYETEKAYLDSLNLSESNLSEALGYCYVIEGIAPYVIHYFQDFISQWSVYNNRKNSDINLVYINEHSLTEGDESPDQHIKIVRTMTEPHKEDINSKDYKKAIDNYNFTALKHLDKIYEKIKGKAGGK